MQIKIKITDDAEIRDIVRQGLKDNDGYCPCKINHIPENKCMCADFREMIKNDRLGEYCGCGLYYIDEVGIEETSGN